MVLTEGQHTAIERLDRVRVTANADAWAGLPDVVDQVTPLRITITNHRDAPLRIRYSYFSLVGRSGRRYAALPPYRIDGSAGRPLVPEHYGVFPAPTSRYTGFRFAPPYRAIYPGMPAAPRTFYYDDYYYDEHYRYWEKADLPTREMLDEALVEGDIDPGGHASGFVYFERIGDEEAVTLEVKLVGAADEASVGTLSIPFMVRS